MSFHNLIEGEYSWRLYHKNVLWRTNKHHEQTFTNTTQQLTTWYIITTKFSFIEKNDKNNTAIECIIRNSTKLTIDNSIDHSKNLDGCN